MLRRLLRAPEGRDGEPSACLLDSQTVNTSANVPRTDQGIDAGERITGRKRHLGTDTLGLLLTVAATAAGVSDAAADRLLLTPIAAAHPRIRKAWADAGYRTTAIDHGVAPGVDVQLVPRPSGRRGFAVIPRRWTIERTFGRLMHHRRLARDSSSVIWAG
ncbi:transposase [Streptomyces sp. PRh5]|uniref:transposase n=1 Tax=Streptomyces sp. PRh5 TaxID=1158056 RepID=UPI0004BB71E2|nr:transposase [Streptomyces sp. PRh5]